MWTGVELNLFFREFRPNDILDPLLALFSSRVAYLIIPTLVFSAIYWCVNKRDGEFIGLCTLTSMAFAMIVKFGINMERPFVEHPELLLDDPVKLHADGPSCPSGHAVISASSLGSASMSIGKNLISVLLIVLAFLIIFSRLWLGVHTPLDIIVSLVIAVVVIIVFKWAIDKSYENDRNYQLINLGILIFFTVFFAVGCIFWNVALDYTLYVSGFLYGMLIGRALENRYVKFEPPKVSFVSNVKRYILGLLVTGILLAIPMFTMGNYIGTGIGGIICMIWMLFLYPYLLKDKLSSL